MPASQKFGKAEWTEKKLNIFISYLDAYLIALKKQPFKKIYIDAFAGTGKIEVSDGDQILEGSAKRALEAKEKFDQYFFVEKDEQKALELQAMVDAEFPQLKSRVIVYCGDANDRLAQIVSEVDWRNTRALLFLDPCGTQVNWTTLELVSKTRAIDVWYLFPFSALNRMLANSGNYEKWESCIDRLLGYDSWRGEFYKDDPQRQLFDEPSDNNRKIRDASQEQIKDYIIRRLKSVFPCVSDNPRIFKNTKNSSLFLFCFAISNDSPRAQGIALNIANHILTKKYAEDAAT